MKALTDARVLLVIKRIIFHLGVTSVIVTGTELIWMLVLEDSANNFFVENGGPLEPPESWKKPGAESSFSLSRIFPLIIEAVNFFPA